MTEIRQETHDVRSYLAGRYLTGRGLEIGALDAPFPMPSAARVEYVDRFRKDDLLRHYPELRPRSDKITDPDIVEDGETLTSIPSQSYDFLVASHFLEHCENPLLTLRNHVRVIRSGGALLLAVPNSAHPGSWDFGRDLTTFEHLLLDDRDGPEGSRRAHFMEWVTFAGKMTGEAAERECEHLMQMKYSIHFHCWTAATFLPFLLSSLSYNSMDAHVVHYEAQEYEILAVLRI